MDAPKDYRVTVKDIQRMDMQRGKLHWNPQQQRHTSMQTQ
jgi:hypothetical protein